MAMASASSTVPKAARFGQPGRVTCAGHAAFIARQIPCRGPVVWRMPTRSMVVRATSGGSGPKADLDVDKIVSDLQEKWENVDDKTTVLVYAGGALAAIWLAGSIVNSFNAVPLLPKFFELVGLTYTAWFTYRYLLFKSSREELIKDVDDLKSKITGDQE